MKRIIKQAALILAFVMLIGFVASTNAAAVGTVDSVAIKLSMPPVNCGDVSALRVSAVARGCYIDSWVWKNIYGENITEKFDGSDATIEIVLVASPGNSFSDATTVTIDGQPVSFRMDSWEQIVVSKTFSPVIWAPSVVKHPGDEEVEIGKIVSFVAYGSFVKESKWLMVDPDGKTFNAEDLPDKVPGVKVTTTFDKLNISPAKYELNGYKVKCEFKGPGGEAESRLAKILVVDKVEEKEEQKVDEEHEHLFSEEITTDAGYHWYDCECGARKNRDEHRYVWTQIQPAELESEGHVTGVCSVCGYTLEAETQLSEEEKQRLREHTDETKPAKSEALKPSAKG